MLVVSQAQIDAIRGWLLAGAPFRRGIDILEQIQPSRASLKGYRLAALGTFVDQRAHAAIKAELTQIAISARPTKTAPQSDPEDQPAFAKTSPAEAKPNIYAASDEDPPSIAALKRQAKGYHQKQDALRAALRDADTDNQRLQIAEELIEQVMPALDRIYDQIRAFAKTGIEPRNPDMEPFRLEVAKECFEYIYLERHAKRGTLTDEQRARHTIYRDRYKSTWSTIQSQT